MTDATTIPLSDYDSYSQVIRTGWLDESQNDGDSNHQPLPGPWFHVRSTCGVDDCWEIVTADSGGPIASYYFWDEGDGKSERIEANFRLMAAAPELVGALEALLRAVTGLPLALFNGSLLRAIRNARITIASAMDKR
jgi:hypothetical protein